MSGRTVSIALIGLGALVSGLTAAVQAGLVTGVRAAWPAHVVAGVLVVVGLVNLRRPTAPSPTDEPGPIRESGRSPYEADYPVGRRGREAFMTETMGATRDGGGGEPDGRD